jgi:predicted PurR-regulated permease PerM
MVTTVITLLTLCVGLVFIFLISLENIDRDIKNLEKRYKNEIDTLHYRFNKQGDKNLEFQKILFKIINHNTSMEERITKLENEILQLKSGDNSKFY